MAKDSIDTTNINVADIVENSYEPTSLIATVAGGGTTLCIDGDQSTGDLYESAYVDLGSIYSIVQINVRTNALTLRLYISSSSTSTYTDVTWTEIQISRLPTDTTKWQFHWTDVEPTVPKLIRWIKAVPSGISAGAYTPTYTVYEVEAVVQSGWLDYDGGEWGTLTQDLDIADSGGTLIGGTTETATLTLPSVIPGDSAITHFTVIPTRTLYQTYIVTIHNANDQDSQRVEDYVYYGPTMTGPWYQHQYSMGTVTTSEDVYVLISPPPIDSGTIEGFKSLYFDVSYKVAATDVELQGMS